MDTLNRREAISAGLAVATLPLLTAADAAPQIGSSPLYAIGIVTADGKATAAHYQRILGIRAAGLAELLPKLSPPPGQQPPRAAQSSPGVVDPSGQKVDFSMSVALLRDFYVKIFEPISDNGPYREHLRKYGMSMQDCQIYTPGDMKAIREDLVRKGGRWVLGSPTDFWTYVDFQETLGTTLEPINMLNRFPFTVVDGAGAAPLGSMPVTQIGFAVADARKAAGAYGTVFGIPAPSVSTVRDLAFPPNSPWSKSARLRVAKWQQGSVGIELTESVGGQTPWSEFVHKSGGNAGFSIGFDVGERFEEFFGDLQAKGGKWVYGRPSGPEALFDFTDVIGLAIKITGTSKAA